MVWLQQGNLNDPVMQDAETTYQTEYGRWNGLVSRNPVLRQIIEIRAASVFSSWVIKGTHEKQATKMLNDMGGRSGRETFKDIMSNLYKIAYISGDAYAEKIYDKNDKGEDDKIIDLHILPSDNIRQIIKKGKIIAFEEINTGTRWQPYQIFHVRYGNRGAMTHGIGMVESLNNTLVSREQIMQIGDEMYERMSRPKFILYANTDNATKLQTIANMIKAGGDSWDGITVLPKNLIDDSEAVQLQISLKPQDWLKEKNSEMFMATCTPELMLGTGNSTSEEDAKQRIAGFMGSVRYDQEMFEDTVRKQIFEEIWENPPEIEFAFTQEAFDAMYNRNLAALPVIEQMPSIAPENKSLIIKEKLMEMGMIT